MLYVETVQKVHMVDRKGGLLRMIPLEIKEEELGITEIVEEIMVETVIIAIIIPVVVITVGATTEIAEREAIEERVITMVEMMRIGEEEDIPLDMEHMKGERYIEGILHRIKDGVIIADPKDEIPDVILEIVETTPTAVEAIEIEEDVVIVAIAAIVAMIVGVL